MQDFLKLLVEFVDMIRAESSSSIQASAMILKWAPKLITAAQGVEVNDEVMKNAIAGAFDLGQQFSDDLGVSFSTIDQSVLMEILYKVSKNDKS